MARKRTGKKASRKGFQTVVTTDYASGMEARRAMFGDAISVRDSVYQTYTFGAGTVNRIVLDPQNSVSVRLNQMAGLFDRYRIKQLSFRLHFFGNAQGLTYPLPMGIDDDGRDSSPPTNAQAVLANRCSMLFDQNQTSTEVLLYRPIDKRRWFYTNDTGNQSSRFSSQATGYVGNPNSSAAVVTLEWQYSYVFCGSSGSGTVDLHNPLSRPLSLESTPQYHDIQPEDGVLVPQSMVPPPTPRITPPGGWLGRKGA